MSALLPLLAASTPARSLLSPAVTVEIAFNAGHSTAASARVWTDVTQYVQIIDGLDITHGRGDERGQADANSLRLVLKNSDGRFTPDLSTGAYYPNVKIGRPIRVSVMTAAGYTSVRFVGYIDEWPLEWPAVVDTYATAAITATSRIARMGASAPLGNVIYEEIKRDNPVAYFMLDNLADSVAGGRSLTSAGSGTAVAFTGTGPGTDGISAATFAGGKYLRADVAALFPAASGTIECFFSTSTAASQILAEAGDAASGDALRMSLDASQDLVWEATSTNGTISASLADGSTHCAAISAPDGDNVRVYIDGTQQAIGGFAGFLAASSVSAGGNRPDAAFSRPTLTGTLAHFAVFNTALSAARLADHATAGLTGFAGETAEARLQRYAAYAGIPTAEQSISTAADTPIAHIDTTGQTALSLMQKVAETDGGVLYDARDGTLTYVARSARYNAAAAVTLDASAGQVAASYAPKLDRSSLINEVVATIADGSDPQETVTAKNTTSYTDYGPHHDDIELATTSADEAHAAAWWRVNTYGEPRARAPQLGVEIAHLSTALQASILALTVGDRIAVTNLPSQSDASSKSFFVEGYTERIGPETHTIDFNISPTTGFDVFTIDDATYGVIEGPGVIAY